MSVIAQWQTLKRQNPTALLMFQLGDFYEFFFDDAQTAAAHLNLVLTRRGRHEAVDVPMCGLPVSTASLHIARLVNAGHHVAVADQVRGDPGQLITRAITRVVTPATTLDEAAPSGSTHLIAIVPHTSGCAVACVDVSRLCGWTTECEETGLVDCLFQFSPSEILAPPDLPLGTLAPLRVTHAAWGKTKTARNPDAGRNAARTLARQYVASMQGEAVAQAIAFRPDMTRSGLAIDWSTRRSLNLVGNGGLLATIDRTRSAMGRRRLAERVARPSADPEEIRAWQTEWYDLGTRDDLRRSIRDVLAKVPDFERVVARIVSDRFAARDLVIVRDSLAHALALRSFGVLQPHAACLELHSALDAAFGTDGAIRAGYDEPLDKARAAGDMNQHSLADAQRRLATETGIASLKVRYHAQFGYVAEVSMANLAKLRDRPEFIVRQGLATTARLSHPELTRLGDDISAARERAAKHEADLLDRLAGVVVKEASSLMALAETLGTLDVAQSCATLVLEGVWCRSLLTNGREFSVLGLRHPELAPALDGSFVPNDCDLAASQRLMLLTGPNMAGKSTYLRQNALAVVLAQAGLPVPAEAMTLGIVDAVFSRVGASDDPARGRSTFMVEMLEIAGILTGATDRSFVIIDEIGRGTSTQDGLAIAQAVLEALHDTIRCRGIFATHFLELGNGATRLAAVQPCTMRVRQSRAGIVFLHDVIPGAAGRSWGVHVAALAGLPAPVVARASSLLEAAERSRPVTELPLFASLAEPKLDLLPQRDPGDQTRALQDELRELDLDAMTARDALATLYRLQVMVRP